MLDVMIMQKKFANNLHQGRQRTISWKEFMTIRKIKKKYNVQFLKSKRCFAV